MATIIAELRETLSRRIHAARPDEIASIVGALAAADEPLPFAAAPPKDAAAPATRFELLAGGVVRDHRTKLEWTRGNVTEKGVPWAEAAAACEKLELAGGGWRLPTQHELLSLVDYARHDPAIDPAFECKSSWYWSSTPYAPDGVFAWLVGFYDGCAYAFHRDSNGFVRAVRGGQF